jgi:hypothetical protein
MKLLKWVPVRGTISKFTCTKGPNISLHKGEKTLTIKKFQEDEEKIIKEDEIFSLWVKQNITIPPLKEYIKEWLKSLLKQITDPRRIEPKRIKFQLYI